MIRAASPREVADVSNTDFTNSDLTVDYILQSTVAGDFQIHVGTDPSVVYLNTETFTVSISQNEVTIKFLVDHTYPADASNPFTGIEIADTTNNLAPLLSTVQNLSTATGFSYSVSADTILINWQGVTFHAGDTIQLDFSFAAVTPPTAYDATVATGEDTLLSAAVPAATGDGPVRYALDFSNQPGLVFHSDGTYTFDASGYGYLSANETATATFGYYAIGADGARSDTHTVTITVHGENDAPVIASTSVSLGTSVATGEQVSAFLSGVTDVNLDDPHGIAITATGGSGTWQYSLDGTTWTTLTASDGAALLLDPSDYIRFVASGPTVASLTYHAWDETSGSAGTTADLTATGATGGTTAFSTGTATATVGLDGAKSPPVANPDAGSAGETQTTSFAVLANDTGGDPLDTLTLVSLDGVVVHSANGAIDGINASADFTIVNNQIQFAPGTQFEPLDAGQTATIVVSYTMKDSENATASSTLTLTVNGVNQPPVANPDAGTAAYNQTESFDVLANDTDIDWGDTKTLMSLGTISVTSSDKAINGINANAAFSIVGNRIVFSPGSLFSGLTGGANATVVVAYTMEDASGATASSTLTLTIVGPPTITSQSGAAIAHYTIPENTSAVGTITATPSIVGDVLHFSIAGGADASAFVIDPNSGVLRFKTAPDSENPTDASHDNHYQVIVKVADGQAVASQTVDVLVTNVPGVTIHVGKGNHLINATHTVHGQPLPTNEDDLIICGPGRDTVYAGAGNDTLIGGMGNDLLVAGSGNDVLSGGWGHNRLIGGPGHDTFVFNAVLNAGADAIAYNFSTIAYFNPVNDVIELSHKIFKAIPRGVLSTHAFSIGAGPNDTADRIIYNPKNGYLIYDPDGSGFVNGIEFAKLAPHLHLTHSDFLIV